MNEQVAKMLEILKSGNYKNNRKDTSPIIIDDNLTGYQKQITALSIAVENEQPYFISNNDIFGFNRYQSKLPIINYAEYSLNSSNNMCIDYESFLRGGFCEIKNSILNKLTMADEIAKDFYVSALKCIEIVEIIVEKYIRKYYNKYQ